MLIADSLRRQDGSPSGLNVTAVFNQSCVLGTVVCCSNFRHLANEAEVTSSLLLVGSNSRYPQRHHWRKGAGWEKRNRGARFLPFLFQHPFSQTSVQTFLLSSSSTSKRGCLRRAPTNKGTTQGAISNRSF